MNSSKNQSKTDQRWVENWLKIGCKNESKTVKNWSNIDHKFIKNGSKMGRRIRVKLVINSSKIHQTMVEKIPDNLTINS